MAVGFESPPSLRSKMKQMNLSSRGGGESQKVQYTGTLGDLPLIGTPKDGMKKLLLKYHKISSVFHDWRKYLQGILELELKL